MTETSEMETEENKTDADVDAPKNDVTAPVANDFGADHQSSDVSAIQPNGRSNGTCLKLLNNMPRVNLSNQYATSLKLLNVLTDVLMLVVYIYMCLIVFVVFDDK